MGVRILGITTNNASDDLIGELRALLLNHHVIVIANQSLDPEELHHFGSRWGTLLTHPSSAKQSNPYVQSLASSGLRKGKVFGAWHSDMSWHPTPPWITMLHAVELPSFGGATGYANQHLAWQSVDQARKDLRRSHRRHLPETTTFRNLKANHTGKGFGPQVPDSIHPVVRTHDETGREALYINPEFTTHIEGLRDDESLSILWPLWFHSITEEFLYRHQWQTGDLVVWDNRSVMHTAIIDYDSKRELNRVVIKGGVPV